MYLSGYVTPLMSGGSLTFLGFSAYTFQMNVDFNLTGYSNRCAEGYIAKNTSTVYLNLDASCVGNALRFGFVGWVKKAT